MRSQTLFTSAAPNGSAQIDRTPLIIGSALMGTGTLLWLIGMALSGGSMIGATRQWIADMETPPSELVRNRWNQARTAAAAGTAASSAAWQQHNGAGHTHAHAHNGHAHSHH